ncbi:GntR family transcriptional regulator, transcriptional repressor for pyruvate dehydrogenase complex [Halobacillus karajensis]|uniref:FadR/GntR family transcriptional regulator n=1 Tax=Halobacillus karajensis TaxID=195088 RepID=UPI0008A7A920|nr:FadR/GntR family transcriptional regulator [Halobacillus karajensis]SEI04400.1 GntR family transcriptional regulator, transcriptional repressor for pyruvate dehydrogenase complex [Halobacillus karajensis]
MKIERKKVSMQVFDRIKEYIHEEKMKPGDRLPTEKQLSEMFGVSRTPVREALSVLEASGLTVSKQGGGSIVQETSLTNLIEETQFEFVDSKEVLNLLETRIILETEAARLAAERGTPDDKSQIKRNLEEIRKAQDDNRVGYKEDIAFHNAIAKASQNPILVHSVENLTTLYEKAIRFSLKKNMGVSEKRAQVLSEHERIYTAIRMGNGDQAKDEMDQHLRNACKKFKHSFDQALNS